MPVVKEKYVVVIEQKLTTIEENPSMRVGEGDREREGDKDLVLSLS